MVPGTVAKISLIREANAKMETIQGNRVERTRQRIEAVNADLSGSSFKDVDLSGTSFHDGKLSASTMGDASATPI